MPFDPAQPANNSALSSAVMRSQLTSLKALIDAIASLTAAQVDGVTTLNPGTPAAASVTVVGNTLHFTFGIPRGSDGQAGPQGQQGPPGEVTQSQLDSAIATTALNPSGVQPLNVYFSNPPTDSQLFEVQNKINELIAALYRSP